MKKTVIISTALAATIGAIAYTQMPGSAQFASGSFNCPDGQIAVVTQAAPDSVQVKCAPAVTPTPLAGLIVAPNGKATAKGTADDPLGLASAIKTTKAQPGTTIWLRGGTYRGAFVSEVKGTTDAAVTIRPYPGENATLEPFDANQTLPALTMKGGFVTLRDLEIANPNPDRTKPRPTGIDVLALGVKVVNCSVHDNGIGIGAWSAAPDAEIYGNLIYRNGWEVPGQRGSGHGLYIQNETGTKRIADNLIFDNYGLGVQIYTQQGAIKNIHLEGNVVFSNGSLAKAPSDNILVGGSTPASGISLISNYTYHPLNTAIANVRLFYSAKSNLDLLLNDNYFVGGSNVLQIMEWATVKAKANTIIGTSRLLTLQQPDGVNYGLANNNYISIGSIAAGFSYTKGAVGRLGLGFAKWQELSGLDADSKWQNVVTAAGMAPKVFVRGNAHESGRANVAVFWGNGRTVEIDLSAVLKAGQSFEVFDVTKLAKPILSGTYDGKPVTLPTPAEFAAFLVRKVN
jgi:hypothetical protein